MSSVNPHYTFEYSQPEAYRFSHDSVFLARKVFETYCKEEVATLRAMDLCAGCGIVGMDFIFHCKNAWGVTPQAFDFLEVQEIYRDHFMSNKKKLGDVSTQIHFLNKNYAQ
ncbi:MAG: methyltransferase, partial [Bdellovibrio sp.]